MPHDYRTRATLPAAALRADWPLRRWLRGEGGLFGRFDDRSAASGGAHFVRPELAVPVGVRFVLTPRTALRAEARFRFDQHPSGASAPNTEFAAGLSLRY